MKLPDNNRCIHVVKELDGDPALSQWEQDFISSNRGRTEFTSAQKEVIARLEDKFEV
jgi:hypothetical protein